MQSQALRSVHAHGPERAQHRLRLGVAKVTRAGEPGAGLGVGVVAELRLAVQAEVPQQHGRGRAVAARGPGVLVAALQPDGRLRRVALLGRVAPHAQL
eukprot:CAMPEP_0119173164 /NCGR_PEP_ID=MMETSP1315-20130426/32058_1 /TAXON_ID=676789 /ORGANISM="Prasinoderma singularis, Strain RCC927" /LENGTH=97 /DNA_ID=CAMNT_0007167091 /DNA_START=79 /DNA_END=369 /DNA_ORIENTATION=-